MTGKEGHMTTRIAGTVNHIERTPREEFAKEMSTTSRECYYFQDLNIACHANAISFHLNII